MALAESGTRTPPAQNHLNQCPACRQELDKVERRLNRLGEMARRFTPEPGRPVRLPEAEPTRPLRGWLTPALAAGITAVLVVAVSIWWIAPPGRETDAPRIVTAEELQADQTLMVEVDQLVENAMPEPYRELASIADLQYEWDEDLIDWIVPSIDDRQRPVSEYDRIRRPTWRQAGTIRAMNDHA